MEIQKQWPEYKMVRGSPCWSATNGGVMRFNWTIEEKIGAWTKDYNSTHWRVGYYIVCWRYNTQVH